MGRWAGVRPHGSSNDGKSRTGKRPDGQARSLTQRLDRNDGLAKAASKGGNLLLNVGPKGNGVINDIDVEALARK